MKLEESSFSQPLLSKKIPACQLDDQKTPWPGLCLGLETVRTRGSEHHWPSLFLRLFLWLPRSSSALCPLKIHFFHVAKDMGPTAPKFFSTLQKDWPVSLAPRPKASGKTSLKQKESFQPGESQDSSAVYAGDTKVGVKEEKLWERGE